MDKKAPNQHLVGLKIPNLIPLPYKNPINSFLNANRVHQLHNLLPHKIPFTVQAATNAKSGENMVAHDPRME